MELVCPAGSMPALKAAVNAGADVVYLGFNNATNARNFAGLNMSCEDIARGMEFAHGNGCRVFVALNTYANPGRESDWRHAVDQAAGLGADALILADIGLLAYAADTHPELARHLSVQASATTSEALAFYHRRFGIRRAVLPRVLALQQVRALARESPVELEVFGFGSLCIMAEGRCQLSSYVTGMGPNTSGVCSPARYVRWEQEDTGVLNARLNDVLIDRFEAHENAGYPTVCKGRYVTNGSCHHALEAPTSLNTMDLLPDLHAMGIRAIKIEGRQRGPAYVEAVTRVWRDLIDHVLSGEGKYRPSPVSRQALARLSEGSQTTLGAYARTWQ